MKVGLTEDGYFSGAFATNGDVPNSVEIDTLPSYNDELQQMACKLVDGVWVYDANKYAELTGQTTITPLTDEQILEMAQTVSFLDNTIGTILLTM